MDRAIQASEPRFNLSLDDDESAYNFFTLNANPALVLVAAAARWSSNEMRCQTSLPTFQLFSLYGQRVTYREKWWKN